MPVNAIISFVIAVILFYILIKVVRSLSSFIFWSAILVSVFILFTRGISGELQPVQQGLPPLQVSKTFSLVCISIIAIMLFAFIHFASKLKTEEEPRKKRKKRR